MSLSFEAKEAIHGVRGILRFDANGLRYFPYGFSPCLRSFQVALWVAPLQALVVWLDLPNQLAEHPDANHYLILQALAYLVSWLAYPLLLLPLSRHFHCRERLGPYLSAFNWFQLVEFAVMTPILALGAISWLPVEVDFVLWLFATAVLLAYEWFMLRKGLGVEGITASSLVLMNFLLNLLIYRAADVLS
jgi:hypothetical protein